MLTSQGFSPNSKTPHEVNRPRGIEPQLLLKQVFNTAPFLPLISHQELKERHYLKLICEQPAECMWENFSWSGYFQLCVSAHFATVATFVPTDLDTHIRLKLWNSPLDEENLLQMVETVIEAYNWDTTCVSTRWLRTPSGRLIEGHKGEWFSIAAAAFGVSRNRFPEHAKTLFSLIEAEIENEALVFEEFCQEKDFLSILKSAVLIAHNLGDLQRVLEAWGLSQAMEKPLIRTSIETAGIINRDLMALENHRHLPLRSSRALRKSQDFLLPLGPFYDDWGKIVATHPHLSPEEIGTILEALIQGWVRLEGPLGYSRALVGIENHFAGGMKELLKLLPSRVAKTWTTGALRQLCTVPQSRFEGQWIKKCQGFLAS
jgi:hypothetical protein